MGALTRIIAAAAAGAVAAHFFDREQGRRRRAVFRDKVTSQLGRLNEAARATAEDLRNRTQGTVTELWHRVANEEVADEVLLERVRAKLGHVVSHPGAIEVSARKGVVMLSGAVLRAEVRRLMQTVWAIPGVQGVEDRLAVHERADGVSALQGGDPAK
jgi:osmotically-inducible protein OsmY